MADAPAHASLPNSLPPVLRSTWVPRAPEDAFRVFTEEIGAWWPLPTHGIFHDRAGGVAFRDGQLVEQSVDGEVAVWGSILEWTPPERLIFSWHPGADADRASEVEVSFEGDSDGTRVVLEHRGWEIFGADAATRRHNYVGPNAWGATLDHFADAADVRPDAADLADLEAAYGEFYELAEHGRFDTPSEGNGWSADQVIAHVTLNDFSLIGVCQSLVHQRPARFENQTCQKIDHLDRWVESCGDRATLVARGRAAAAQHMASLRRLSPAQLATDVACHLTDDGEVMLDDLRPWRAIAIDVQAAHHLPGHMTQLADLASDR